ncbi:hypothetical protein BU24DRAFT_203634 [Aaosphaeria arxii CBS 175.79]|uniref:Uncharacterized protein n=1 Tax=Aaosphaeria arxii CBS 175.79 TaxID=1450172 RepID=A0A6A5XWA7_9PLEO|nr:uncharacterized protein BU24DRAFT_203634 [Aaosphaeria arxii CBS 175.79]KAF2016524.1 hypothetical protein BU24DRAFT_203634 [Aaosphaeria arxii CBS 175.79]
MLDQSNQHSFLLGLPTEIRLQIYDYCLADANVLTITAAPLTVFGHNIKDTARAEIPGVPRDYSPLFRYGYDSKLLSLSDPPSISLDVDNELNETCHQSSPYYAPQALMQSCGMIYAELSDYMRNRRPGKDNGGLALYLTYPYGVLVLKELYPFLLSQAKAVYISGYYNIPKASSPQPTPFINAINPSLPPRPMRLRMSSPFIRQYMKSLPPFPLCTAAAAPRALARLVRTILSPKPGRMQKLESRIVFPEGSYADVWCHDDAPINQILRNTCGGSISMHVSRGDTVNCVHLVAKPNPGSRTVSTNWSRWMGSEKWEDYVIGPEWPEKV